MTQPFINRIQPAPKTPSLYMKDYWVWCGSAIRGDDGRYHLFASRWPKTTTMVHWATHSEVVRASSDNPAGPYTFEEVVIAPRGEEYWDGRVAHNPTIHYHKGKYLLIYTGATYRGEKPAGHDLDGTTWNTWIEAWHSKRPGLLVADSVFGPWKRFDRPLLDPRPGKWDSVITSNPAPCVHPDGSITLVYKSTNVRHTADHFKGRFNLGVARAASWQSPFERLSDNPITLSGSSDNHIEDPYIWWNEDHYEMIVKDMTGEVCGEAQAGIHATSRDAIHWEVSRPAKAYSRTVLWEDGTTSKLAKFERPQLLIENGRLTHLFAATFETDGKGKPTHSWNMVVPLQDPR